MIYDLCEGMKFTLEQEDKDKKKKDKEKEAKKKEKEKKDKDKKNGKNGKKAEPKEKKDKKKEPEDKDKEQDDDRIPTMDDDETEDGEKDGDIEGLLGTLADMDEGSIEGIRRGLMTLQNLLQLLSDRKLSEPMAKEVGTILKKSAEMAKSNAGSMRKSAIASPAGA